MRARAPVLLLLTLARFSGAQSHPSWWTWVSPGATALVGIRWEELRGTVAARTLDAGLFGNGGAGLPNLECLRQSRQMVLSSPPFLAVVTGACDAAALKVQAPKRGLRRVSFKGVELWMASAPDAMSVARLSDQLALVGARTTLQAAIEQWKSESGREYSPLLAQAAPFAERKLWVVTVDPADPFADVFLAVEAAANQAPEAAAAPSATPAQPISSAPAPALPPKPAPPARRVVRILGLEDGPREIELPPN